jgi:hypothetical protein
MLVSNGWIITGRFLPNRKPKIKSNDVKVFLVINGFPVTEKDFFEDHDPEFCRSLTEKVMVRKRQIFYVIMENVISVFVNQFGLNWCGRHLMEQFLLFQYESAKAVAKQGFKTDARVDWNKFRYKNIPSVHWIMKKIAHKFWEVLLAESDPSLAGSVEWENHRAASYFPSCVYDFWKVELSEAVVQLNRFLLFQGVPPVPNHLLRPRDSKKYRQKKLALVQVDPAIRDLNTALEGAKFH